MSRAQRSRPLSAKERRLLVVLGVPTLTMAYATTVVSTYLPVVARNFTHSAVAIGLILAGEGLTALFIPLLAGSWSDTLRARGGSRLTFLLAGTPVAAGSLAVLGLVGALPAMGVLAATFFAGWIYGCALAVLIFTHATPALLAVAPVVAFGGGLTMTLPYAILIPLMPARGHGMLTGFYSLSRGLGVMLGPLLAGGAIDLLRPLFPATHGYAAMWIVSASSVLASIPVLGRLRGDAERRWRAHAGARAAEPELGAGRRA